MDRIKTVFSCLLFFMIVANVSWCSTTPEIIRIQATPGRVQKGDTVKYEIQMSHGGQVRAVLLKPALGYFELSLQKAADKPGIYQGEVILGNDATEGLYVIHAWEGNAHNPASVGKASFLLGKMVVDFLYPSTINSENPDREISRYLQVFHEIGGNSLIAHGLIGRKAHYPSNICKSDIDIGSSKDIVEAILHHGDKKGYPVLLSVSWDLTRKSHSKDRMDEIKSIMKELYTLYRHHPSLAGFYTYLEGSGTYFAPFLREFCDYVKTLNPGLLSGCAPYTDDPMLAGYISIIESLDIIIYQGMVMASYRPDNRKMYPLRRVKDFCSLGVGAKWLQNKIALTHVELFGYLENRMSDDHSTTTYENIYLQILSAAMAAGADGISFFTYSSNIFANSKKKYPEIHRSSQAVEEGMKAYDLVFDKISNKPNNLTVYFPHSDWVIERWFNYFLPALDAFRNLGIPVDILPYAPPLDEDYPYWPSHTNEAVCPRLLKNKKIIILPNISGFKRTDSDWIKDFVEQGGAVIAFGPKIPMARSSSYDRKELFGVEEAEPKVHSSIIVEEALGSRISSREHRSLHHVRLPVWKSSGAKVIAAFEDGSPAVLINHYGKGTVATIALDAASAARQIPGLVRDVIDYTMASCDVKRAVDILGTDENVDVAVAKLDRGFRVAVVNHNTGTLEITLRALDVPEGSAFEWIDMISGKILDAEPGDPSLKLRLPARGILCVEFRCADLESIESRSIINGDFWKFQALQDIIPYWTKHAIDRADGAFITHLDRSWNQIDGTEKYPSMISRHIFSYSVAFLFTGEEKHIEIASEAVDFLLEHAWDKKYGGWFDVLDKKGNPLQTTKSSFVQFYANTGLAMYYFVTHDPAVLRYIEKSNEIIESKRWDSTYGGYFNILNQDLSVQSSDKPFSCGVVPVSGYLLYLYLATREVKYLHQAERIMKTVLARMQDPESKWILESFNREWHYKTRKDNYEREVNIGHNIETVWMFYRLFLLNGNSEYINSTKSLSEKIIKWGFEKDTGLWHYAVGRSDPSIHSEYTYWWIQAYGNMYNLYNYRLTNDEKYIEYFQRGAGFWNEYFIDREFGDTYTGLYLDGKIKDGKKASKYKTSYHSMENSLLTYLYLDLWVNRKPVELYFMIDSDTENTRLYPSPIEDMAVKLEKVIINGKPWSDFSREEACVNLPAMEKIKVKVVLSM